MNKSLKIPKLSILAITLTINILLFNFLPNRMVINYSIIGQPNYSVNKLIALAVCPLLLLLTYGLENTKIPKKGSDFAIFSSYIAMLLLDLFVLIFNL